MRRRAFALLIPLLLTTGCGYNQIQTYDEQVNAAKGQIEVALQRRADLIPNLVETVKGFAQQESEVLTNVTQARAGLQQALQRPGGTDVQELANANAQLSRSISVVVEAYPELRSNENFLRLQDELAGTENRIAVERRRYNELVRDYNIAIRRFPRRIFASLFGFEPREFFQAAPGAQEVPTVDFGTTQ